MNDTNKTNYSYYYLLLLYRYDGIRLEYWCADRWIGSPGNHQTVLDYLMGAGKIMDEIEAKLYML